MANYVSNVTIPTDGGSTASYNVRELFPHVGNCTDAAATAAKTVTIGNFKLYTGAWVVVKFSNTNSAAVTSLTLNVDGTGAKPIKYRNANLSSAGLLIANRYTYFIYDGTNYQIVGDFDTTVPSNNVTGSGTSGYLTKWNGTNTITNGPKLGSSTTTYLRNDGEWATPPDTKNTAGSTDTSSKIFLIGATSQAANPQTYSDNEVYTTSGVLTTKKVQVGGGSCTMEYNSTTQSLDFIFT